MSNKTVIGQKQKIDIQIFGNFLAFYYAQSVKFNKVANDPDGTKWDKFVSFVKENESEFFDKNGDFKKKYSETFLKEFKEVVKRER